MIVLLLAYLAAMVGAVLHLDRRMRSAQAAREAAFLRSGFAS